MKKTIVTLLTGAIIAGGVLTGCSSTTPNQPTEETTVEQEAPAEEVVDEDETVILTGDAGEVDAETEDEAKQENVEEDNGKLPVFAFSDDDPYKQPIWEYFQENIVDGYLPADISLPVFDIFREDDSDPEDIKVWGEFWIMNYDLKGTTLMTRSGGEHPGLFHLKADGDGFVVTDVEFLPDGGDQEAYDKIFSDDELKAAYEHSRDDFNDSLLNTVEEYRSVTGVEIKAYQDYGWDPVPLTFDEELNVEYPDLAGNWNTDGITMEIGNPEDGNVYPVVITDSKDENTLKYDLFGQYEYSTNTLYYYDGWVTNEEGEDIDNNAAGAIVLNEDNTITWTRDGEEDVVFERQ